MNNCFFSIIIPVYNISPYLPQCLDSVIQQSFKEYEVILVDDGSTDDSLSVIKLYAKKYSSFKFFSQENCGPSVARNVGIEHASGKYLIFLDGDDYISHDSLKNFYSVITANKNKTPDIVWGNCICIYPDGRSIFLYQKKLLPCNNPTQKNMIEYFWKTSQIHSTWGICFSKQLFKNVRYDPNFRYFEDTPIYPHILARSNFFAESPYSIYYYRQQRKGSSSYQRNMKKAESWFLMYQHIYEHTKQYFLKNNMDFSKINEILMRLLLFEGIKNLSYVPLKEYMAEKKRLLWVKDLFPMGHGYKFRILCAMVTCFGWWLTGKILRYGLPLYAFLLTHKNICGHCKS